MSGHHPTEQKLRNTKKIRCHLKGDAATTVSCRPHPGSTPVPSWRRARARSGAATAAGWAAIHRRRADKGWARMAGRAARETTAAA